MRSEVSAYVITMQRAVSLAQTLTLNGFWKATTSTSNFCEMLYVRPAGPPLRAWRPSCNCLAQRPASFCPPAGGPPATTTTETWTAVARVPLPRTDARQTNATLCPQARAPLSVGLANGLVHAPVLVSVSWFPSVVRQGPFPPERCRSPLSTNPQPSAATEVTRRSRRPHPCPRLPTIAIVIFAAQNGTGADRSGGRVFKLK